MNTLDYIVNKYGLLIGEQPIVNIPNVDRSDLAQLFKKLQFKKGAEIGVERGMYSEVLCKANPEAELYSIDPWQVSAYEPNIHGIDQEQEKFEGYYEVAKARLSPYNCSIIRKDSVSALKDFADESLDFVYIDANHDFANFANDLHHWTKKVRSGGIVSGHDYALFPLKKHNHVKKVLLTYIQCYSIAPLFILGADTNDLGFKRDKYRSWMFVKDKTKT